MVKTSKSPIRNQYFLIKPNKINKSKLKTWFGYTRTHGGLSMSLIIKTLLRNIALLYPVVV
jgi:hypothetical protein